MSAAEAWGDPVGSWERTTSSCGECGTVYGGYACPCCGERADSSPVGVIGYVAEDDNGSNLTIVSTGPEGVSADRRPVTADQVAWLRRGTW